MDWTDAENETLRTLWEAGQKVGEIVKSLKRTRNAIIGKAHRMGLSARQSPIRKLGPGESYAPRKKRPPRPRSTLPTLPSLKQPPPHPVEIAMSYSPHAQCQYILGERVGLVWEYCLHPTVTVIRADGASRSSYCAEHHRRCYTRKLTEHSKEIQTDWLVGKTRTGQGPREPLEQLQVAE